MMQQKHKEDYEEVLSLISKSKSLAISRFADGEASILQNVMWAIKTDGNM